MRREYKDDISGTTGAVGEIPSDAFSAPVGVRLGVVGATHEWLASLRGALLTQPSLQLIAVSDLSSNLRATSTRYEWDLALAFLSARSLQPLTDILTFHDRLGYPELVAIAESPNDAAVLALREFGVERVLSQDSAATWLPDAVGPLASIAVAKRLLRRSRGALREAPQLDPLLGSDFLPLSVAEGRFREAYLRALMAKAGSRAQAAKGAGVPYRTLCYMLERYGIGDSFGEAPARATSRNSRHPAFVSRPGC
jgi:hypothetical protein